MIAVEDLLHGVAFAFFLLVLVVVLADDQPDPEVKHLRQLAGEHDHPIDEIDVLHPADVVAEGIEPETEHGLPEDVESHDHAGVPRVPIGPAQRNDISFLVAFERSADHADVVVSEFSEHLFDVLLAEQGFHRDIEDELDAGVLLGVQHADVVERAVERIRPGVAFVHLDEINTGIVQLFEPGASGAFVGQPVRHDDDTRHEGAKRFDLLHDAAVAVAADDGDGVVQRRHWCSILHPIG